MGLGLLDESGRALLQLKRRIALTLCRSLLSDVGLGANERRRLVSSLAADLSRAAWDKYNEQEYRFIEHGIELMEQAWTLSGTAEDACRLGLMYERANRNDDSIAVYRRAFRAHPEDERLRYQTAIQVLRHGRKGEARAFLSRLLAIDPKHAFASYALASFRNFDRYAEQIHASVRSSDMQHQPFFIVASVWGASYVAEFLRFTCASLLASGNLPALRGRLSPHILLFTTAESEREIRSNPIFERLCEHATCHFFHFDNQTLNGTQAVQSYFGESLGNDYAVNCKFLMFSSAHYAALEAGRRLDALVMPLGGDNVVNSTALSAIATAMEGDVDAVAVTGFRLEKKSVVDHVEAAHRREGGVLEISSGDYGALLAKFIPENNFVDSARFTHFPLILCWRVGDGGVLVHSNHYHPVCIRARGLDGPVDLTIDPVDGRFMHRNLPARHRIHVVGDTSVVLSDWGDNPLVVAPSTRGPSKQEISLWLWMYWDSLRETYFRAPLRIGERVDAEAWAQAERHAAAFVDEVVAESLRRQASNVSNDAW